MLDPIARPFAFREGEFQELYRLSFLVRGHSVYRPRVPRVERA
jgi:hypothetical protein